jgi:hypothetical protein
VVRFALLATLLAAMLALYVRDLQRPGLLSAPPFVLTHPLSTVRFLHSFYGGPFGSSSTASLVLVPAAGALFAVATLLVLVAAGKRRLWPEDPEVRRLALGLLGMAHAVALVIALGRAEAGTEAAMASRYTSIMLLGWLVPLGAGVILLRGRRTARAAAAAVSAFLALGLLVSAGKLHRVATWKVPERVAGARCLREVLADPDRLPERRSCLLALYPDTTRLLDIARRLPPGWGGLP